MTFRPAWPIRRATDGRGSRWIALTVVVLGHLVLLAWWRERPMPATQDAPLLQGRLLSVEGPSEPPVRPAPSLHGSRRPVASPSPRSASLPDTTEQAQQPPAAVQPADAIEARTLDLGMPPAPNHHAPSQAERNVAASVARGTGHAFGADAASAPRAANAIGESRSAAGRWQARVEVGGRAYCLNAQDPSLRRDPFEKALAVPSICSDQ